MLLEHALPTKAMGESLAHSSRVGNCKESNAGGIRISEFAALCILDLLAPQEKRSDSSNLSHFPAIS